jgi:hypothetical protein
VAKQSNQHFCSASTPGPHRGGSKSFGEASGTTFSGSAGMTKTDPTGAIGFPWFPQCFWRFWPAPLAVGRWPKAFTIKAMACLRIKTSPWRRLFRGPLILSPEGHTPDLNLSKSRKLRKSQTGVVFRPATAAKVLVSP